MIQITSCTYKVLSQSSGVNEPVFYGGPLPRLCFDCTFESGRERVMKLAIIGCGEVGRLYAAAAAPHFELVLCDAYPSAAAQELAEQLGVELKSSIGPWLADMDRVW